jgi:ribosomal protein S2
VEGGSEKDGAEYGKSRSLLEKLLGGIAEMGAVDRFLEK